MADTHQDPSLKNQLRIAEDMYERVRLHNLKLNKRVAELTVEVNHLQAAMEVRDQAIRELREKLKPSVKR